MLEFFEKNSRTRLYKLWGNVQKSSELSRKQVFLDWLNSYPRITLLFVIICIQIVMSLVLGLNRPFWGDEGHFVTTIIHFANHFELNTLADYDQVTGPAVYIIFACWGSALGLGVGCLRILSLLFSLLTFLLIYSWFNVILREQKKAFLLFVLLMLNPYMWGLSFFVFTDIPTLLWGILLALAVYEERPLIISIATALALLSRQYMVLFIVAASLYFLVKFRNHRTKMIGSIAALIIGSIPLIVLMYFWRGIAPPSGIARWTCQDGQVYHYSSLTAYVTFLAIYSFPLIIASRHKLMSNLSLLASSLSLSAWYLFFPVRPSIAIITQTDFTTIGLVHRVIRSVVKMKTLEEVILWFFFFCGITVLFHICNDDIECIRQGQWDYKHFLTLTIICFLLIMPFSYQVWEKYLVMILPFFLLRLMLLTPFPLEGAHS